jgi:putative ABC transport system permease protein
MLAHKLRVILTTISIALGVAFVAGTLILTDTTQSAFDQLFGRASSGTDAVVRHEVAYAATAGVGLTRAPTPAGTLDKVRHVHGVAAAEGIVTGYALITDTEGKAVIASGGAPAVGYTMPDDVTLRGSVHLLTGHAPTGAHEVAIDATSAASHHIPLGANIRLLFRGPAAKFTVVGTVGFGNEKDFGGTTSAYFAPATAQRVLGAPGLVDQIEVRSDGTITDAVLAERIGKVLPHGLEAVTGATLAKESSQAIKNQFAFLSVLFLTFAGVALFVGSFIIWNTFTMIVSQRTREIALTRAIGASRRQVIGNLLAEAGLLGVVASAVGVGLGVLVAKGLNNLMAVLGFFKLPSASTQVQPRTIWVSMIVGTLVTVVAALVPARRATKVLPIQALREATPGAKAPSRFRAVAGALLVSGGVAGILDGLYGGGGDAPVFLGMLASVVGVLTLAPVVVRPLASVIGAPLRLRGVAGDLARQNALRNPRRTASTASALMIGLTLVVAMGVFGSSLKASFATILHDSTNADLYVTAAGNQGGPFSPDVEQLVRSVPGVAVASATGAGEARFDGTSAAYSSVDPSTVQRALNLKVTSGSAAALGTDGVMVKGAVAKEKGWHVGDRVPVEFAATGSHSFTIRAVYDGTGFLDGDFAISLAAEEANVPNRLETSVLVMLDDGADQGTVKSAIAATLATHPDAEVLDRKEYAKAVGGIIDSLLALVTVMLLLSVVIALLGIVNTLALSVHERTREVGLLRAVGMTTAQVRSMVRWESVVISLIGALVGAGLGLGLGAALAQVLKGQGITEVAVPGVNIGIYVVAAAVAGVVAAVGPGRAAARVDVLKAVVTD